MRAFLLSLGVITIGTVALSGCITAVAPFDCETQHPKWGCDGQSRDNKPEPTLYAIPTPPPPPPPPPPPKEEEKEVKKDWHKNHEGGKKSNHKDDREREHRGNMDKSNKDYKSFHESDDK